MPKNGLIAVEHIFALLLIQIIIEILDFALGFALEVLISPAW